MDFKSTIIAAMGFALLAVPSAAQAPGALSAVQTGLWQLNLGGNSPARNICVRRATQFVQLAHAGQRCQRRVLGDSGNRVSVRYECSGSEWGQTEIVVETPRLVRIDTQGIRGGAPFHNRYEARRTGSCS